jgi:hypothetical protein
MLLTLSSGHLSRSLLLVTHPRWSSGGKHCNLALGTAAAASKVMLDFGTRQMAASANRTSLMCPRRMSTAASGREADLSYEESGRTLRHYWTTACPQCPLKSQCTSGPGPRIRRWGHEQVLEAVQQCLDKNPQAMRQRRETVEHPFATLKMRMGATHFLMKRLPKVATEMALHVLAYNLTRNEHHRCSGIKPLQRVFAQPRPRAVIRPPY